MKYKFFYVVLIFVGSLFVFSPGKVHAEGGIFASGGGSVTAGQTFTVTVRASGATFDSVQGTISVSGPVDVVSFTPGNATWLPGKSPANGSQFVGMVSSTSSLTVATIKLRGKSEGSGSVTVSGSQLAFEGNFVGTASSNANFTVKKAPNIPGNITVASASHPDQEASYEATTVAINWDRPNGATGFSYLIDESDSTTPPTKVTSNETSATFENLSVGTHYFHIRAQNADGWGGTTHFKVSIKEPSPKVNSSLAKPSDITITFSTDYQSDITNGTVTGIIIRGKLEPEYYANLILDPAPTVPENKQLSTKSNSSGRWEIVLDYPIKTGFYKLVVQGQKDKILTPESDTISFEISQANGGSIAVLNQVDATNIPAVQPSKQKTHESNINNWLGKAKNQPAFFYGGIVFLLLIVATGIVVIIRKAKQRKLPYDIMNFPR